MSSMEELIQNFILVTEGPQIPAGEVYFEAENPKGTLGFYIVSKGGGVPWRLKIRSPSFCNLSILPKVSVGAMISDVVEGDQIVMTYVPGKGTIVSVKGAEKGVIEGKDFADALFAVWLGANPVQEDLKKALLGG